ncbi:MAG TPA: Ig-like domain-containing protein, partial [Gemmatimonadales bacterium]|nr:Ig-like domain-containing protein [Gemmatimonadales bacterium]
MLLASLALLAAFQQPQAQQPPAAAAPSPVKKIVITPANPVLTAGDSIRLTAVALGADGNPVPDAKVRFRMAGGRFEGAVDSMGLVTAGSTGTLGVAVIALVPGTKPYIEQLPIKMLPGSAARIEVTPQVTKLVAGQRLRLVPSVYSAINDKRADQPKWTSSASGVVKVAPDGMLTAVAPGTATLTASAGSANWSRKVTVVANAIGSLEVTPGSSTGRTGDVIRFRLVAKDKAGRPIEGLTPTWSFSPGQGAIGEDGAFVGYEQGSYTVTASLGVRTAEAAVTLTPRDVRRPAQVVGRLPR